MRVMVTDEGLVECCEGITDHMPDCRLYVGVDPFHHNSTLVVEEPKRTDLRYARTTEFLRREILVKQNGHGGSSHSINGSLS